MVSVFFIHPCISGLEDQDALSLIVLSRLRVLSYHCYQQRKDTLISPKPSAAPFHLTQPNLSSVGKLKRAARRRI